MLPAVDHSDHHVNMEQRRTSNASDTATLQDGRPVLSTQESVEFIPTRGSKVTPPKPAANPLQFIKVGPCDLYKTAQEQIKKVEEVKKIKAEVRDDAEDWQSNLDNWKCGRRKRQEHIIERVVEVKKLELEEHDRNRRRSKTFNEMMEDRNSRGRKTSLMVYKDDEANDLSDLGIGTSSGDDNQSLSDREERLNIADDNEQKEEYTYDQAIQTYVNFAEKARNTVNETTEPIEKKTPPQLPFKPRRESAPKIEEKIAFLDERRKSSTEINTADKVTLVKVDVLKRRELFERGEQEEVKTPGKGPSTNVKVSGSIKDRLSSLEQHKSCEKINAKEDIMRKRLSNGDMSPPQSVKERLSSLQKQTPVEQKQVDKVDIEVSIKERVDNLDASVSKLPADFETKFTGSERSSSPEDEIYATKRTQFHRSLDSLDRDEDLGTGGFDRVQSLEDLDLLGNRHYPPSASSTEMLVFSSQSGDTDREDSGIHTADVSSSVSQADEDADLDVEVVNHRRQLSEQSEQLSPLPPIQEVTSRGDEKAQSDDVSRKVRRLRSPMVVVDIDIDGPPTPDILQTAPDINVPTTTNLPTTKPPNTTLDSSKSQPNPSEIPSTTVNKIESKYNTTAAAFAVAENKPLNTLNSTAQVIPTVPQVEPSKTAIPDKSHDTNLLNNTHTCETLTPVAANSASADILPSDVTSDTKPPVNVNSVIHLVAVDESTSSQISEAPVDEVSISEASETSTLELLSLDSPVEMTAPVIVKSNKPISSTAPKIVSVSLKEPSKAMPPPDHCHTVSGTLRLQLSMDSFLRDKPSKSSPPAQSTRVEPVVVSVQPKSRSVRTYVRDKLTSLKVLLSPDAAGRGGGLVEAEKRKATEVEAAEEVHVVDVQLQGHTKEPVVEAVIAQRCSENMMMATRESETPEEAVPTAQLVDVEVEAEQAPVVEDVVEIDGGVVGPVTELKTEILPLTLDGDVELLNGDLAFPLGPPSSAEPPKEKPPPPPTDLSDEETKSTPTPLRRVDSTKRIKKEIRRKRSDFLGIEGNNDDSYLEPVLSIAPDMTAFLLEEQRQQKQLYRQSICSESDSNPGESRDSGVELDMRARLDDQPLLDSAQHSRQESEIYGNGSSVTSSEEDEIAKKEREIIEMLEKEEQWRYANNANEVDLGEKLAEKLRQLEQEKLRLEWERREEESRRIADENIRREETMRLRAKEQELREQEENYGGEASHVVATTIGDGNNGGELIRAERERLMAEQEELVSQRENLIMRETQQLREQQLREQQLREQQHREQQLHEQQMREQQLHEQQMREQQLRNQQANYCYEELPPVVPPAPLNYHLESTPMPRTHRAPPPIPPAKPMRSQDQRERSIINSRVPSADFIQQEVRNNTPRDDSVQLRRPNNEMRPALKPDVRHSTGSQMSRQTLQALSAAPRSRIVSTDNWIQAKRKPDTASSCNYQHWLIQEAEHRRITEMNQRQRDKPLPDAIINTLTQRVQNRAAQKNQTPIMVNTVVVNNNAPPMNKSPMRNIPTNNNSMMNHRPSNSPNVNHSSMSKSPKMNHVPMNSQHMNVQQMNVQSKNGQQMNQPMNGQQMNIQPMNGQQMNVQPMNGQQMNVQPMNGQQMNVQPMNGQHMHIQPMNGQPMNGQPINIQPINMQHINGQPMNGQPMNGQPMNVQPVNGQAMNGHMNGQLSQESQEKMLSVSGKKKCSHCSDELGRGAAMIIESLRLFYHIECFQCCVCHVQLGDGLMGTDVRVRNNKLHCHNCYSSDDGVKFSCV